MFEAFWQFFQEMVVPQDRLRYYRLRGWNMKGTRAVLSAVILFAGAGCAVKSASVLTPTQQISFTANQTLSAVAAIDKSLASDVIAISNTGAISKPLTNSVLSWQKLIAQQVIAAETIQRSGQTDAQKALAIKAAFASLPLPADVKTLLGSTQTDQAVLGLITTIQSVQSLIAALTGGK